MLFDRELDLLIRARYTLVLIASLEEERVTAQLTALCDRGQRTLFAWDQADLLTRLAGTGVEPAAAADALAVLDSIHRYDGDAVFLLKDFHLCWRNQPRILRKLRNVVQALKFTGTTIIVTTPGEGLPDELKDEGVAIDLPPPGADELQALLDDLAALPGVTVDVDQPTRQRIVHLSLGLSLAQARRVFGKAMVSGGALRDDDIEMIAQEKREIIRGSGALEYYAASETLADVGGLERLKDWLRLRALAFGDDARAYGLPIPKGIALIGVPGTGKSLTAKMIASLWWLPLIRLDVGALFGGFVGESERNTRQALHLAEAVAPCVLWIDELEKALSVGEGDGGTGMRVLGKLLSWMQDKRKPVFIVATANDISRLPPELLRRGRFDEIFFLDLPTPTERQAILSVHLAKRGRDPAAFDLAQLAEAADGYVGAEIEQSVIDALFLAFSDPAAPRRPVATGDVREALRRLVPMSRSQRERIAALRRWVVEGRAQSAS